MEQFLTIHEALPEPPKKRGRKKKRCLIGQVGAGKDTRGGIIDIAIMQSLFEGEEKEVKSFVEEYGMVIVDECHHVAAFTFEKVLKTAKAKYVYGLSATPMRKDGHHPIIFMQCGPIRYLVDAKSQADKRMFSHFVIPRFTRARAPAGSSIQELYAAIVKNENRNVSLVEDAVRLVREGRSPILLTERKEHAAQLASLLEGKIQNVFLLVGSDKPKEKREKLAALQAMPASEEVVVVATGSTSERDLMLRDWTLCCWRCRFRGAERWRSTPVGFTEIMRASTRFVSTTMWTSISPCWSGCITSG